jgi:branched-chain amino acid aminotransferase
MSSSRPDFAIMNGEVVPFTEARISIMAPGLTFAVAVFEGLRAYWNETQGQLHVFRIQPHLDRLQFGIRLLEIADPPTNTQLAEQITAILRANKMREDCYIRLQAYVDDWGDMTATGPIGTSVICRARPRAQAFETGKHFSTASWRRNQDDASPPRVKATANYLNSRLAGLEAKRNGFDGAIILNHDGTVAEGPGGCIFMHRDGMLVTPSVNDGILESVTRDTLLRLANLSGLTTVQRRVGRTELYLADEVFYCGTGQEITPILSVDGKPVGSGTPGEITRLLQSKYDKVVRGNEQAPQAWLTPIWET